MKFRNFESFEPVTAPKELQKIKSLYEDMQSENCALSVKMARYASLVKLLKKVRKRIEGKM